MRIPAAAVLLLTSLLTSCGNEPRGAVESDGRTLAQAAGHEITVSWFEQTYIDLLIRTGSNDTKANRAAHLDRLIDSILLAEEFQRRALDESDSFGLVKERIKKEELGSRYFETSLIDTMQAPTEDQIRQTFRRWNSRAVVRHLFFTSPSEAERSWDNLENGVSFVEEARRVYDLPEVDSTAGYLGPVRFFNIDDAFAEAAWSLQPGTYSRPVRSRYGWHIIYLENMIVEPLLTESEYQRRRPGMSSQYRLRRRRLEGDRFVRTFMMSRGVEVNEPAIEALGAMIKDLDPPRQGSPEILTSRERSLDADLLRSNMDSGVVLATYEWDGRREAFTAGDYAFWLPALTMNEARERIAASVGRAMRNELLARAGREAGLQDVEWQVDLERRLVLEQATKMREYLRADDVEVDTTLIKKAFDRLGWRERRVMRVSFDAALFKTERAARAALADGQYDWDLIIERELLDQLPDWNPIAATAPVDSVIVVGRRNDWVLLRVRDRERIRVDWEDDRAEIVQRLQPFVTEYRLVRELRDSADISIDSLLFEQIEQIDNR